MNKFLLPTIGCFFKMPSVKMFCLVQWPKYHLYVFAKSNLKAQVTPVGFVNICFEITVKKSKKDPDKSFIIKFSNFADLLKSSN